MYTADAFLSLLRLLNLSEGFSRPLPDASATLTPGSSTNETATSYLDQLNSATQAWNLTSLHQLATSACDPSPYISTCPNETFSAFDQIQANIYRYRQQRSINLGSWCGSIIHTHTILRLNPLQVRA
jgi:glucan 1,3-beta-glucosidase